MTPDQVRSLRLLLPAVLDKVAMPADHSRSSTTTPEPIDLSRSSATSRSYSSGGMLSDSATDEFTCNSSYAVEDLLKPKSKGSRGTDAQKFLNVSA